MPDPQRVLQTVRRATDLFQHTPGRTGTVVQLDSSVRDVVVAGDLHGNLQVFRRILDYASLASHPDRHLVLQELVHSSYRYPDGGCKSHQLVDVIAALKCQFPDRVHLILGNHELSELSGRPIIKAGERQDEMFRNGIRHAYGTVADDVYSAYLNMFFSLPLAVRTQNKVFISHSIPSAKAQDSGFDLSALEAAKISELSLERGFPLYHLVWGRDLADLTARRFARLVESNLLITGHVPCENGFAQPNSLQIILDCVQDPAAAICFPNQQPLDIDQLLQCVKIL